MQIKPLNLELLEKSVKLLEKTFPLENNPLDDPKIWIPASLNYEKNKDIFKKTKTTSISFWCAVENDELIGIIGAYEEEKDENDTIRIAWFAVDEKYRGKGIGKKLLQFIFDYSKALGKKYIRVYTDPKNEIEKVAQILYEKFGLKRNIKGESELHRDDVILREFIFKN